MSDEANQDQQPEPISVLEKVATAVSALLILALLSVLAWDAVHPNTQPVFTTEPGAVSMSAGSYRVPVTVRNSGDEAAKAVVVRLELMANDSTLAESDVTVDWLPGRSSRDVVGLFARPASGPQPTNVRVEVRGYATP